MYSKRPARTELTSDPRIRTVSITFSVAFLLVIIRLFILMILQHEAYSALAVGSHETYAQLYPERGLVYLTSREGDNLFPLAINQDLFVLFADTREIPDVETAQIVAQKLAEIFVYDDERKLAVFLQLQKEDDPYEPIEQKVTDNLREQIDSLQLQGIHFVRRPHRLYPEGGVAANVIGFVGKDEEGNDVGRYGIEGYWNTELVGSGGFLEGTRTRKGSWIPLAGRIFEPAQDGPNITLTLDRTLQFKTCEILKNRMEEYKAQSAALVIMEPKTGAIKAMCSFPTFDPNTYNEVPALENYNNTTIFTPYEPGSIFKPVAMAAALNEEKVNPQTPFYDPGSVDAGCTKLIQNADLKQYGNQTMTGVLENSINTGMVFVARQLGKRTLREYIENFGFGVKTGVELDTEAPGNIQTLFENDSDTVDCYTATASFGQGITATPLQMVSAFSTIVNGGMLMKPYIVDNIEYPDGKVEKTKPREVRRVLEKKTSSLLTAMLVRVIDNGQGSLAKVPGYYVGGKTGTAQIAGPGGYTADTNHSFVGFGPADDPQFVMIIKFEKPERAFSSLTAAPTFAEITKFIMQYYHIPPER